MRGIAYLRVSTDNQVGEDRFGLEAQREAIETYCNRNGVEITGWVADEGLSGSSLSRPGLQSLFDDAGRKLFDVVVVAKMDRLSRDLMASLWVEKELMKFGVEIISVAEPFRGSDPANVLFRQIIGAFAQFEKSRIAERMSGGRIVKAKRGGYAGGGAPMGYQAKRGGKALAVDQDKERTVRRVFELKTANPEWTLQALADALNGEGHTTAKGTPFKKMQVKRVLDRRDFYAGFYRYSHVETAPGKHQAIL